MKVTEGLQQNNLKSKVECELKRSRIMDLNLHVSAKRKRLEKQNKITSSLNGSSPSSSVSPRKAKTKHYNKKVSQNNTPETSSLINLVESPILSNSVDVGKQAFECLISPITCENFFKKYWERKPLLIKRKDQEYYSKFMSFEGIDKMLRKEHIEFTTHIDVTTYKHGNRETLNPDGRATAAIVWPFFQDGCSIRMLSPHNYFPKLYKLNSELQEYFACFVGANAYLTPPNSQGFAPHYDDIEAFVLQVEGSKHWKLYAPSDNTEVLPRYSSHNFTQEELGKLEIDVTLNPGDLLYFPRGTIHQASALPDSHSLHITLSMYQKNSYADLFEKLLPAMLNKAIKSNVELRRGIPLNTFKHLGLVNKDQASNNREKLKANIQELVQKCLMETNELIDDAVDQMAIKFQHEALPPNLTIIEKNHTIFGVPHLPNNTGCAPTFELTLQTKVRLLRANVLRLVKGENGLLSIYYYLENAREYCKFEANYLQVTSDMAPAVEHLIRSYPKYIRIQDLNLDDNELKMDLASPLWERGLLMTKNKVSQ